jgi:hypothetical protein
LQVGLRADFTETGIIVVYTTMEAVGILDSLQEVSLNAFGTGIFFTIFTYHFFTNDCRIIIETNRTRLGLHDRLLGFLGWHGRVGCSKNRFKKGSIFIA